MINKNVLIVRVSKQFGGFESGISSALLLKLFHPTVFDSADEFFSILVSL